MSRHGQAPLSPSLSKAIAASDEYSPLASSSFDTASKATTAVAVPNAVVLARTLGFVDLTLLGISASIGSGVFVLSGVVLKAAGPGVAVAFVVASTVVYLDALCYAELAGRYPQAGGAYMFATKVFGTRYGLLVGANVVFDSHVGNAAVARSFAGYLAHFVAALPGVEHTGWIAEVPVAGILNLNFVAPALILGISLVLLRGAAAGASLNRVLVFVKLATIAFVVIAGASRVDSSLWTPLFPRGLGPMLGATATLVFSVSGFDNIANCSEEASHPARDVPNAMAACIFICLCLYLAVMAVLSGLEPYREVNVTSPLSSAFDDQPGLHWAGAVVDLGGCVSLCTILLVACYANARFYVSLARDGAVPAWLAGLRSLQPGRGQGGGGSGGGGGSEARASVDESVAPVNAQVFGGALSAAMAAALDVDMLASLLSIGVTMSYASVAASVCVARATKPRAACAAAGLAATFSAAATFALRLGAPAAGVGLLGALLALTLAPLLGVGGADDLLERGLDAAGFGPWDDDPTDGRRGRTSGGEAAESSCAESSRAETPLSFGSGGSSELNATATRLKAHKGSSPMAYATPRDPRVAACPGVPLLPWLAVVSSVSLMALLPWAAWARLAAVSAGALAVHARIHR